MVVVVVIIIVVMKVAVAVVMVVVVLEVMVSIVVVEAVVLVWWWLGLIMVAAWTSPKKLPRLQTQPLLDETFDLPHDEIETEKQVDDLAAEDEKHLAAGVAEQPEGQDAGVGEEAAGGQLLKQQVHHREQVRVGIVDRELHENAARVAVEPALAGQLLEDLLRIFLVGG